MSLEFESMVGILKLKDINVCQLTNGKVTPEEFNKIKQPIIVNEEQGSITLYFKPIEVTDVNGATCEEPGITLKHMLAIVRKMQSQVALEKPSRENSMVSTKLDEALLWLYKKELEA